MAFGNGIGYMSKTAVSGAGTVTEVGLAAPASVFNVANSPVNTSGTLTLVFNNQAKNKFLASPIAGAPDVPIFREINLLDLPSSIGTVTEVNLTAPGIFAVSGSPINTSGTLALTFINQGANLIFAAPNGAAGAPSFRALVAADMPTAWNVAGNILSAGNFLGSTNNIDILFKRQNIQAGKITASGVQNTFFGLNAGLVTTGLYNTFIGDSAGKSNTTGLVNSAFGVQALFSNTTGRDNVAFGSNSLYFNISGNENMGIGSSALERNTTGLQNIAIGGGSSYLNQTGNRNVSIGHEALRGQINGSDNITFGYRAGYNHTGGNNNLIIGSNQDADSVSGSNQMNIKGILFGASLTGNKAAPAGRLGIRVSLPNAAAILDIGGTDGGLLVPRLTDAQILLIPLVAGNIIYNATINKHQGCNGATWNDFY